MATIINRIQSLFKAQKEEENKVLVNRAGPVPVKIVEIGTAGTEIFSGYIQEEYLKELTGLDWADKVDQMRRSDANVSSVLGALKYPLLSANWYIAKKEESEEADRQAELMEKILFEELQKGFTVF